MHDMPMMKGISTLLDDELKTRAKPRKKHKFSEINSVKEPSGGIRYMCKPTIHSEKGEFKRTTIASSVGGSREECEIKVYEKIRSNLNIRYQSFLGQPEKQIKCCEDAVYDYERFRTIAKSKNVRMDIEQMLDKISRRIILKKGECEYV